MSDNEIAFETALNSVHQICKNMNITELNRAYKLTQALMDVIFEQLHQKAIETSSCRLNDNSDATQHTWDEEYFEIHLMKPCYNCSSVTEESRMTRGGCSGCKSDTNSFCSEKCFSNYHSSLKLETMELANIKNLTPTNLDILSQLPDLLKANFSSLVNNPMLLPFGSNIFSSTGNNFFNSEKNELISTLNSLNESQTTPVTTTPKTRGRPRGSSMIATSLRKPRGRPPLNNTSRLDMKHSNHDDENTEQKFEVKRRGRPPINGNRSVVSRGRGTGRLSNGDNSFLTEEPSYKKFCPSPPSEAENLSSKNYLASDSNNEGQSPVSQNSNRNESNRSKTPNSNASNGSNPTSNMESILQSLANSQALKNQNIFTMPFLNHIIDSRNVFESNDNPSANNNNNNNSFSALQNGLHMPVVKNE